jgi:hypothetical protein
MFKESCIALMGGGLKKASTLDKCGIHFCLHESKEPKYSENFYLEQRIAKDAASK